MEDRSQTGIHQYECEYDDGEQDFPLPKENKDQSSAQAKTWNAYAIAVVPKRNTALNKKKGNNGSNQQEKPHAWR